MYAAMKYHNNRIFVIGEARGSYSRKIVIKYRKMFEFKLNNSLNEWVTGPCADLIFFNYNLSFNIYQFE